MNYKIYHEGNEFRFTFNYLTTIGDLQTAVIQTLNISRDQILFLCHNDNILGLDYEFTENLLERDLYDISLFVVMDYYRQTTGSKDAYQRWLVNQTASQDVISANLQLLYFNTLNNSQSYNLGFFTQTDRNSVGNTITAIGGFTTLAEQAEAATNITPNEATTASDKSPDTTSDKSPDTASDKSASDKSASDTASPDTATTTSHQEVVDREADSIHELRRTERRRRREMAQTSSSSRPLGQIPFLSDWRRTRSQQPLTSQSHPLTSQSHPLTFQSQPQQTSQSQPLTSQSQPQTSQSQPQTSQSQPQTSQSQPQISQSQPLISQSQPQFFMGQGQPSVFGSVMSTTTPVPGTNGQISRQTSRMSISSNTAGSFGDNFMQQIMNEMMNLMGNGSDVGFSMTQGSFPIGNDFFNMLMNLEPVPITLSRESINALPVFKYGEVPSEIRNLNSDQCTICLENYQDDDEIRVLLCKHIFHTNCIDRWLGEENVRCPVCRLDNRQENNQTDTSYYQDEELTSDESEGSIE